MELVTINLCMVRVTLTYVDSKYEAIKVELILKAGILTCFLNDHFTLNIQQRLTPIARLTFFAIKDHEGSWR